MPFTWSARAAWSRRSSASAAPPRPGRAPPCRAPLDTISSYHLRRSRMASPEYVVCLDCESPCYSFEWSDGELSEVLCEVCGNDLPDQFILPEDMEELDEP